MPRKASKGNSSNPKPQSQFFRHSWDSFEGYFFGCSSCHHMLGALGDFAKFPVGNFRNRYEEMVKHPIFSGSFEHPIWWIWQRKIPTKSLWLGSKRYMDGTEKPGSQWKCWGISSYFLSCKFVLERKAQFLKIPALLCFCFLLLGFANNLNFERLNSWGVNGFRILEIYPLTPPLSSNHHS